MSTHQNSTLSFRHWNLLIGGLTALIVLLPSFLQAQSPLTIQPSTGNVGIGTTNPTRRFVVNTAINRNWKIGDNAAGSFFGALNDNEASWVGGLIDASPLIINTQSAGNVGIGITSPGYKLDVVGNIQGSTGGKFGDIEVGLGAYSATIRNTASPLYLNHNTANNIIMAAGSPAGNVGIGTTGPSYPLHVSKSGLASTAIGLDNVSGTSQATARFLFLKAGVEQWSLGNDNIVGNGTRIFSIADNVLGLHRLVIDSSGNVGVGTTSPASRLHVIGDITASGAKNFQIDHPLEPDKKLLVHSALEGPEAAVYYRGEAQLVDGEMEIALPAYFEALTRKEQRTVQLSPIDGWAPLYVAGGVKEGKFIVRTANGGDPAQRFYWEVKAVRADVTPLIVEKAKDKKLALAENPKAAQQ